MKRDWRGVQKWNLNDTFCLSGMPKIVSLECSAGEREMVRDGKVPESSGKIFLIYQLQYGELIWSCGPEWTTPCTQGARALALNIPSRRIHEEAEGFLSY